MVLHQSVFSQEHRLLSMKMTHVYNNFYSPEETGLQVMMNMIYAMCPNKITPNQMF